MILHRICIQEHAVSVAQLKFNFHKGVQQHIWGEVIDFVPAFSAVYLRMRQWTNY